MTVYYNDEKRPVERASRKPYQIEHIGEKEEYSNQRGWEWLRSWFEVRQPIEKKWHISLSARRRRRRRRKRA